MAFEQNDGIDGELTFLPHADEFKMHLDAVVYDALKVVTQPARLLTHPDFNLYVQPSINENGALGEGVGKILSALPFSHARFLTHIIA